LISFGSYWEFLYWMRGEKYNSKKNNNKNKNNNNETASRKKKEK